MSMIGIGIISKPYDWKHYGGSGGSIYLRCKQISTNISGEILFNVMGDMGRCNKVAAGGGGRISIITTGTDGVNDWIGSLKFPTVKHHKPLLQNSCEWRKNGDLLSDLLNGGAGAIYAGHSGHRVSGENLGH